MEQDKPQKQEACTALLSLLKTFQETLNDQRTQFFFTSVLTAVLSNHVSWMPSTGHPRMVKGGKGKEYDLHCPRRHGHHHLNKQLKGIHGTNGKMAKVNSFVLLGSDTKTLRDLMYLITYFTRATAGVSTVHINANEGKEGEGVGGGDELLGRGRGPNGFVDHMNNNHNPEEKEKEKGGEQAEDRGREDSAEGTDEESAQLTNEDFATSNHTTTATATTTTTHSAEGDSQPPAPPAQLEALPNHQHEASPRQNPEGDGAENFHRSPNHLSTSSLASLSASPTSPPSPSPSRGATVPARSNVVQLDMLPLRYRPSSKCCHLHSFCLSYALQ